ncbi:MalY/PatB family protein [Streptobacillus moniliformis]|uniref:cysteine-S-conjugate beta-lyase n=1 Tax=Streptobacillus moniliformis (strain ATCC 14647 / DSM 12112 / NCTC 10651 / 9901) TaxID=519441 RepID=D1AVN2_STRM9|nr:aminotransferase class I/II-fold pyridoxal phosphate-dependent enzyme [Streptobacillus moniliformis]ACZ01792.1 aminotransferase class I and II [Streptobacillus moniliformis DSM 12112]AVL43214.1 aminotransferase [Streptobacillus moniliformis]QXW65120.1 aminotransferase class I/II-fold pyridoxal phosphate-dependent enzyme [Streptobacillus moniliformis]SQA13012.1 Cystathionine beta-lyase PatB [Streptobacillus moniliformis]
MKNNFDTKVDSKFDLRRKWDRDLIEKKFNVKLPKEFIPLWIADMDFLLPEKLSKILKEYIAHGSLGYTSLTPDFYNSIINWQKRRHNVEVKKEWINIGYGTVSTLHLLNKVYLNKGEYILINTPSYEPFYNSTINSGNKVIFSPLKEEGNRYFLDYEDIEEKIKKYSPKLFIFCNPHNPSGRIWEKEEIEKLASLCLKYNVILVSDEVHSEITFEKKHASTLSLDEKYLQNLIFLSSPNKAFNLGGLKTSYSIIPNKNLREKLEIKMKENSITSPNILGLVSMINAYNLCEDWLDDLSKYIYQNYIFVKEKLEKKYSIFSMESSYLLWIKVENGEKLTKELAQKGILVESGTHFVANGEKFIRINLGIPRKYLEESIKKMN